jgi:hypothetical protein
MTRINGNEFLLQDFFCIHSRDSRASFFVISFVIRISSFHQFVLIRVHLTRRSLGEGGFVVKK